MSSSTGTLSGPTCKLMNLISDLEDAKEKVLACADVDGQSVAYHLVDDAFREKLLSGLTVSDLAGNSKLAAAAASIVLSASGVLPSHAALERAIIYELHKDSSDVAKKYFKMQLEPVSKPPLAERCSSAAATGATHYGIGSPPHLALELLRQSAGLATRSTTGSR